MTKFLPSQSLPKLFLVNYMSFLYYLWNLNLLFSFFFFNGKQHSSRTGMWDWDFRHYLVYYNSLPYAQSSSVNTSDFLYLQSVIQSHPVCALCYLASLFSFCLLVLGYMYTVNLCWHVCVCQRHKERVSQLTYLHRVVEVFVLGRSSSNRLISCTVIVSIAVY